MPEESTTPDLLELVRGAFETVNRRDLDALGRFYAPNVVQDMTRTIGGAPQGWTAIRGDLEDWMSAYEEFEWSLEAPVDLGAGVVFAYVRHQKARPVGTAGYVQQREAWVWLWVDGLIESLTVYPEADIDEARATAERLAQERGQAMSETNVELAKRVVDAFNRGGLDAFAEHCTADVEWFPSLAGTIEGRSYKGREGMERYFEHYEETWERFRVDNDAYRPVDDRVLACGRLGGDRPRQRRPGH